jgi:hypothetical protein
MSGFIEVILWYVLHAKLNCRRHGANLLRTESERIDCKTEVDKSSNRNTGYYSPKCEVRKQDEGPCLVCRPSMGNHERRENVDSSDCFED